MSKDSTCVELQAQQVYLRPIQQVFNFPQMTLGKQIRYYRDKLQLTLEELSERSDVDVGTISALEVRGSQRSKYAPAIARALGLSLEQLLDSSRDWTDQATKPVAGAPIPIRANDTAHPSSWPLPGVTPEEFYKVLHEQDRREVVAFVRGLLSVRQEPLARRRTSRR
ncbi:helix-turn-helix domain-containing protein [Rhizobacter sp. Root1221]|uniref:helix-turn-helix domain-containing protein n=1 Tax=Rhizobacter sp. Root1221 TaxID=1736433 RepID=UPI001F3CF28E|nr:helix-turn-helix transcriptional regulator [Rhizobacter sp. Root1221]